MRPKTRVIESGYRIVVDCDGDGDPDSYGSMSAVGPRHFLTAGHMACPEEQRDSAKYWALDKDMNRRDCIMEMVSGTVDVARVKLAPGFALNETWARVDSGDDLELGDTVLQYTGGSILQMFFKVGYIGKITDKELWVSQHGVPGNSGSGVFNGRGELVGVLWGGQWDPSREFFFLATRPSEFANLLVGI